MKTEFSIAAVERDVGLSKDVLRVWERRYGFPNPGRDANGERVYPAEQVARLRLVKRLMDQGFRPGRLLEASDAELATLASKGAGVVPGRRRTEGETDSSSGIAAARPAGDELLGLVGSHDAAALLQGLRRRLARAGLRDFVQDTAVPMAIQVGQAWQEGRLQVHEEHLFTEQVARVLREAIAAVPEGDRPRTLLTTVPNEPHALGLLMLEALLALEGARCIALGTQLPLIDIAEAARAHRADVVALSFSAAFPQRQVLPLLQQLRGVLPRGVEIWVGGAGVRRLKRGLDGVVLMTTLQDGVTAVQQWNRPADEPARGRRAKARVSAPVSGS
jgi:DNA-binding transcriptional MerR regulator/methylmalonyl-CoA mutase cobalamin-binding subunit